MRRRFDIADLQIEEGKTITPELVAKILKRSEPILVTGGKLLEDEHLSDLVAEIVKRTGSEVIATGGSSKPLLERGIEAGMFKIRSTTLHNFTQEVLDGNNDLHRRLLVFVGFEPYLLSRMLSSIKHFSKAITISIDEYYQPHARLSFPDAFDSNWYALLENLVSCL